ncbi:hypothetical protein [Zhongshania sp. BJYM1]|uniref:hypothetical protein n=1 Tax=Zhongshania aquatica TaxID=2965069 RepID=UPI0022B5D88D|nr:hypothetical protein [Marortus sp. BJYM1]
MLVSFLRGLVFASATGMVMAAVAFQFPSMRAVSEEERIFNAENADLFGEDPYFYTHLQLRDLAADEGGEYAIVNIDGVDHQLRSGDMLVAPCLAISQFLKDAVLLDHCGSYALLWLNGRASGSSGMKLRIESAGAVKTPRDRPHIVDLRGESSIQQLVSDYRRRLYDRPLSLVGAVKVDVLKSENSREYYISPGRDKAIFPALALEPKDKIRAIDGVDLSEGEALTDVYEHLDDSEHLVLTLERNREDWVILLDFDPSDGVLK